MCKGQHGRVRGAWLGMATRAGCQVMTGPVLAKLEESLGVRLIFTSLQALPKP